MGLLKTLRETLDWGKRIQFVFQAVGFLLSATVYATARAWVRGTSIPAVWHLPIYLLSATLALLLFASIGRWCEFAHLNWPTSLI
jgi:hypothetical protein